MSIEDSKIKKECCCQEYYSDYKKPHKCPVCAGTGNVPQGFYQKKIDNIVYPTTTSICSETCRACTGSGIVWGP